MSVTINVDVTKALSNMGLEVLKLTELNIKVVPYVGGAKFVQEGEVIADWPAAPAKIGELAQKGFDAANHHHTTLKENATIAFNKAIQAVSSEPSPAKKAAAALQDAAKEAKVIPVSGVEAYDVSKMKTGELISLAKAEKLYQPVKGTSSNSRYYAVGIGANVKVAARIKDKNLSVRVEGPGFASVAPALIAGGVFGPEFGGQYNDSYASMHVEIKGVMDAQKVIGAVLAILTGHILHPVPDVKILEGKS